MKSKIEIYALQIILAIFGLIWLTIGLSGIWMGPNNMEKVNVPIRLDNHYRYLSSLVLGLGLTLLFYVIPRISKATIIVRIIVFLAFLGGIARVIGLFRMGGIPDIFTIIAIIAELVLAPILCYWQGCIAQRKDI